MDAASIERVRSFNRTVTERWAPCTIASSAASGPSGSRKPGAPSAASGLLEPLGELAVRFERGFDPAITTPPDAAELKAPNGLFLWVAPS